MDTLPIELVTMIACDTFELFTTLLRVNTIGQRLCEEYPQMIAGSKFISGNIDINGSISTYLNGKLHSVDDHPAFVCPNNDKFWYRYGELHRGNDLPAIEYASGSKSWYWNGERHRDNAPAIMWADVVRWYDHGRLIVKK